MGKRRGKRGRWGRRIALLLAVYALAAVLPYAFPPRTQQAEAAFAPAWEEAAGDRATVLATGEEALAARLNMIANAQTSLIVGSYLYADDESGHLVAGALLDAADRGVQVRLVVDGLVGRINLLGGDLGYALGTHPNIELRLYNPLNLLTPWTISARYHEKYVVADGRIFVLGGRNISDEFLTPEEHPAYNYDLDVLMWRESPAQGSAADTLTAYFDRLWDEWCAPCFEQAPAWRQAGTEQLAQELREKWRAYAAAQPDVLAPLDWQALTVPVEGFALLANPAHDGVKEPLVWSAMTALIAGAQERAWLLTPYVVLDAPMRDELAAAAERCADLRVLTNSRAGGNNIVASADGVIHRGIALSLPMEYRELQAPHSMHTKALLVDGDVSVFGSFNVDPRSAYSDTEVMLAVRSEALNERLEAYMLDLAAMSLPVEDDGSYGEGAVEPLQIAWGKNLLILLASPVISLVRFLI